MLAGRRRLNELSVNMSISALLRTNAPSLFTEMSDLHLTLRSPTHVYTCIGCIQEAFLKADMSSSFVLIDSFKLHREGSVSNKDRIGGVMVTNINSWSGNSEIT